MLRTFMIGFAAVAAIAAFSPIDAYARGGGGGHGGGGFGGGGGFHGGGGFGGGGFRGGGFGGGGFRGGGFSGGGFRGGAMMGGGFRGGVCWCTGFPRWKFCCDARWRLWWPPFCHRTWRCAFCRYPRFRIPSRLPPWALPALRPVRSRLWLAVLRQLLRRLL